MTPIDAESSNVNLRTVQLVKLLTEVGPDVPEISRRLGQFKESVRYRYKEKIINKGFAVQAAVDNERLGLKRLLVVLEFAEEYKAYAQAILASMNELCYLISFSKVLVAGNYVVNFAVPEGFVDEVKWFLSEMKENGMFSRLEILDFEWIRNVPMKAEHYDFDSGRWDFDWSDSSARDYDAASYAPSHPAKFDFVDLLLIKELQMDANKSLKVISDNLGVNYKKLAWHFTTHVKSRKLLRGYTVNWMGTRYDYAIEKALHRKHRYLGIGLIVRNVNAAETMSIREKVDRLPYLWAEAAGRNYYAEFAFPVDFVVDGLEFLGDVVANVKDRAQVLTIDQTDAARFTIPYKLFDPTRKRWVFDGQGLITRFEGLLMEIRGRTG
ncbi:MAG: hypothetical protein OK438_02545 [Thaumarchaeota archaeon]|nr:hypothetical protein [Nitrososphaerota archaeon]